MLSVVVPVFNESECLPEFARRLRSHLDAIGEAYEVLLVDDGSTDGSADIIARDILPAWGEARLLRLTRNFGHMAALECGLRHSSGRCVVTLDGDLQHPPEEISRMLQAMDDQHVDVVQMVRLDRSTDGFVKRLGSQAFYSCVNRVTGVSVTQGAADYRMISARVRDALLAMPEKNKVYRLLIPWMGFPTAELSFEVAQRYAGTSKYTLRKMMGLARSGFTTFGFGPLRLVTVMGLAVGLIGLLLVVYVIGAWILEDTVAGWASVFSAVLVLGGLQLLIIGLIGEYLVVALSVARARPEYVVLEDVSSRHDLSRH